MAKVRTNIKQKYISDDAINIGVPETEECISCEQQVPKEILSPLGLCPSCINANVDEYDSDNNGCW